MKGTELFKVAVTALSSVVEETPTTNGMQKLDIDWLAPHQVNFRIIQAVAHKLELPLDQVIVTVNKHANTSAASIPLAFSVAVRDAGWTRSLRRDRAD